MTNRPLAGLDDAEAAACSRPDPDAGIGALRTTTGNLPLEQLVVRARIVGLNSRVVLTQTFRNPHDVAAGGDLRLPAAGPRRRHASCG